MKNRWSWGVNIMLVFLVLWNFQLQKEIREVRSVATLAEIQQLVQQIKDDLPSLILRSQIQPEQIAIGEGLSSISRRLGLVQAGEFRSGNGIEPGLGFSGVRIGYPPFLYDGELWNIAGIENDDMQVGIRASDGKLIAGGGKVTLGRTGILIANGSEGYITFEDAAGNDFNIGFFASGDDFQIQNLVGSITLGIKLTDSSGPHVIFQEDALQDNRAQLDLTLADQGTKITFGGELSLNAEGASGGTTHIQMMPTTNTPSNLVSAQTQIYIRNDKFIVQYNDGVTVRYKYILLNDTSTAWVHTTTAP